MNTMSDNERGRNIRFPQYIWDALDSDASRCKRSAVKQLEALLTVYYDLGNIDVDKEKLKDSGQTAITNGNKKQVLDVNPGAAEKKSNAA